MGGKAKKGTVRNVQKKEKEEEDLDALIAAFREDSSLSSSKHTTDHKEKLTNHKEKKKGEEMDYKNLLENVELVTGPKEGRYLRATRFIPSGRTIIYDSPYAHVVTETYQEVVCTNCFESAYASPFMNQPSRSAPVVKCGGNCQTFFCSAKCYQSFTPVHKYECNALRQLYDINKKSPIEDIEKYRLAIRIAALKKGDETKSNLKMNIRTFPSSFQKNIRSFSENIEPGSYKNGGSSHEEKMNQLLVNDNEKLSHRVRLLHSDSGIKSLKFFVFDALTAEEREKVDEEKLEFLDKHLRTKTIAKLIHSLGIPAELSVTVDDFAQYVFAIQANAHSIVDPGNGQTFGLGIYPFASMINHSCDPNTHKLFSKQEEDPNMERKLGPSIQFRAIRDIYPGEEICYSYTDRLRPRLERRKQLEFEYRFTCTCATCESTLILPKNYNKNKAELKLNPKEEKKEMGGTEEKAKVLIEEKVLEKEKMKEHKIVNEIEEEDEEEVNKSVEKNHEVKQMGSKENPQSPHLSPQTYREAAMEGICCQNDNFNIHKSCTGIMMLIEGEGGKEGEIDGEEIEKTDGIATTKTQEGESIRQDIETTTRKNKDRIEQLITLVCSGCNYRIEDGAPIIAKHKTAMEILDRKLQTYTAGVPSNPLDAVNFIKDREMIHSVLHRFHYMYYFALSYTSQFIESFIQETKRKQTGGSCCNDEHCSENQNKEEINREKEKQKKENCCEHDHDHSHEHDHDHDHSHDCSHDRSHVHSHSHDHSHDKSYNHSHKHTEGGCSHDDSHHHSHDHSHDHHHHHYDKPKPKIGGSTAVSLPKEFTKMQMLSNLATYRTLQALFPNEMTPEIPKAQMKAAESILKYYPSVATEIMNKPPPPPPQGAPISVSLPPPGGKVISEEDRFSSFLFDEMMEDLATFEIEKEYISGKQNFMICYGRTSNSSSTSTGGSNSSSSTISTSTSTSTTSIPGSGPSNNKNNKKSKKKGKGKR